MSVPLQLSQSPGQIPTILVPKLVELVWSFSAKVWGTALESLTDRRQGLKREPNPFPHNLGEDPSAGSELTEPGVLGHICSPST